jgi:hypothetical protein
VRSNDGILKSSHGRKNAGVIKRNIAVFAFFLLISFVLWYLNSLGKEIEAGLKYDVKYSHIPKNRIIVRSQPSQLNIFLKGPGYSILKQKISGGNSPVLIDISKVSYKRASGSKGLEYFIITAGLAKSLNVQMRSGCEITSIKPDTLFFSLARMNDDELPKQELRKTK